MICRAVWASATGSSWTISDGVAAAGLGDRRRAAPTAAPRLPAPCAPGASAPARIRLPNPWTSAFRTQQRVDADGALDAARPPARAGRSPTMFTRSMRCRIRRIDPADHVRQHRVHQVVRRARQHAVGLERRLAGPQEPLAPFAAHPVVMDVAEQARRGTARRRRACRRRARARRCARRRAPPPRRGSGRARAGAGGSRSRSRSPM